MEESGGVNQTKAEFMTKAKFQLEVQTLVAIRRFTQRPPHSLTHSLPFYCSLIVFLFPDFSTSHFLSPYTPSIYNFFITNAFAIPHSLSFFSVLVFPYPDFFISYSVRWFSLFPAVYFFHFLFNYSSFYLFIMNASLSLIYA